MASQLLRQSEEDRAAREGSAQERAAPLETARKFLGIRVGDQAYGIETRTIREIVPVEKIDELAHFPPLVLGVTQVRGASLMVLDFGRLVGGDPIELDARSCLVIAEIGALEAGPRYVGLVADEILDARSYLPQEIDRGFKALGGAEVDYVEGLGRSQSGVRLLVDLSKLLQGAQCLVREPCGPLPTHSGQAREGPLEREGEERIKILSVSVGRTTFGIPLSEVGQLIPFRELRTDESAPDGVGALQCSIGEIPVVNTARALGLPGEEAAAGSLVVVERCSDPIGFCVEATHALDEIDRKTLVPTPVDDARGIGGRARLGFAPVEDRALEVLTLAGLLSQEQREAARRWISVRERTRGMNAARTETGSGADPDPRCDAYTGCYLVVRAGRYDFALPNRIIHEILPCSDLTRVPRAPREFSGVLDLRGESYAVMNLARRLDITAQADAEDLTPCIVLVSAEEAGVIGLQVDGIRRWTRVEAAGVDFGHVVEIPAHSHYFPARVRAEACSAWVLDVDRMLEDTGPSYREEISELRQTLAASGRPQELAKVDAMLGSTLAELGLKNIDGGSTAGSED